MDWTSGLDWWTDIFMLKITFVLYNETSLSCIGLAMRHFNQETQFSLCRLEVNNYNATTMVRPCFTLCLVCSMV